MDAAGLSLSLESQLKAVRGMFTAGSLATEDVGRTDPNSKLVEAAGYGELSTVKQLLDTAGVDINFPPAKVRGRTALQAAAAEGHVELTQLLLARGANVNAPPAEWYGRTPLQAAAQRGHAKIVHILLEAGADVNAPPAPYYGRTALQAACSRSLSRSESNNAEVCRKLLKAGAHVNAPAAAGGGMTALQAAAHAGTTELIYLLLEAGADIEAPPASMQGVTALQGAALAGHADVVEILLAAGANPNAASPCDGRTPLHTACAWGNLDVAKLLHEHGAQFGVEQIGGRSCIHLAASYGRLDVLQWILSLDGVEIDAQDYGGATALHLAEYEPHIVDCLLRAGANTELEDFRQLKPLNIAVERRSTDIVRKLLQYGATVKNITALEWRSVFKAKPYDTVVMVDDPTEGKSVLVTDKDPGVNLQFLTSPTGKRLYCTYGIRQQPMHDIIVDPKMFLSDYIDTKDYTIGGSSRRDAKAAIEWKWSPFNGSKPTTTSYVPSRLGSTPQIIKQLDLIEGLPNIKNVLSMAPRKVLLVCHASFEFYAPITSRAEEDSLGPASTENNIIEAESFETTLEKTQISWIMTGPNHAQPSGGGDDHCSTKEHRTAVLQTIEYRSTISNSWIPKHSVEFFTHFVRDLHEKWKYLLQEAEAHLANTREVLLISKGCSEPDLIEHLLKDAQKWSDLRALLQLHIQTARTLEQTYRTKPFLYEEVILWDRRQQSEPAITTELERLAEEIDFLNHDCAAAITQLEAYTKEMIGLEFSLVSIHEAQRSTSMAASMKRLSWITFVFLPLMYTSSLFGMNINLLHSDPDWRWYLVFCAVVMAAVLAVWAAFKYTKIGPYLERLAGTSSRLKLRHRRRRRWRGGLPSVDLEMGLSRTGSFGSTHLKGL